MMPTDNPKKPNAGDGQPTQPATSRLHFSFGRRLPVTLQSEVIECGHACLAMILGFYGHDIDLATLRRRFPTSLHGVTMANLMKMAGKLDMATRLVQSQDIDKLAGLSMPCILHWEMNHFVVLKSIDRHKALIHDPARGVVAVPREEMEKAFTGMVLELYPTDDFQPKKEAHSRRLSLMEFCSSINGLGASLLQLFGLTAALQVLAMLGPYHTQLVIDRVLPASDTDLLVVLGVGFLALSMFGTLVDAIRSWVILHLSSVFSLQLFSRLFRHLLRLPMDFFEKRHVGDIQSRFGSLKAVQDMLTTTFVAGAIDGLMLVPTLGIMIYYNGKLALVALAATLIYSILQFSIYRPVKRATEASIVMDAKESTHFLESLRAMQPIKVFGKEHQRHSDWLNRYVDSINADIKLGKINILYGAARNLLVGAEAVVLVWMGGHEMLTSAMSVGMFFAFFAFRTRFSGQAQSLVDKTFQLLMLRLHLERLADIALHKPEQHVHSDKTDIDVGKINGSIRLENVTYSYSEADGPVLNSISLSVDAGECLAISGVSGCGKTTLIKVMMGLDSPDDGKVYVDDIPVEHLGLELYRGMTAAVMQKDKLLSGSLMANIAFFDPDADIERVRQAARDAEIMADIEKMPMGLQTLVGDMGSALSGGQEQRILLARALYRHPKILFMDEATSHLDSGTEKEINLIIGKLQITRIIVAHRQETLALADRVIEFDQINNRGKRA